ncbi:MAG: PAS domain S-box protein [Candidatus Aminicenantes bacterium]|nr:PAS domain S-box protein [Candidatus Aminicenantes bacterium]
MIKEKFQAFSRWLSASASSTSEQRIQLRKARLFSILLLAALAAWFFYMLLRWLSGAGAVNPRHLFAAVVALLAFGIPALASLHRLNRMEIQHRAIVMEKEGQYRSLVENINEAIFTLDTDGCFTYVSPAVERISQYKVEDIEGRHFSRLVHPDDLPTVEAALKKVYSGTNKVIEFRIFDKDSKTLYVRASSRLITGSGQPTGLTGLVADISEKKKQEAQLQHARKMESEGRLAGAIAHDFNNLITVIKGYCRMLAADISPDQPAGGFLKDIQTATDRAASLTERLLAFSRRQPTEPRVLNINEQLAGLENTLHRLIGENISLEISLAAGILHIKIDPVQLEQVIINLVVNAGEAMPKQGMIRVETANAYLDEAYCRQFDEIKPGDYVMILAADTGRGIPEEIKEFLFEPFFTTKEPGKGTGLGLSAVYGIVKQNRGHICFESEPGKGTTFKIYFPVVNAPVEEIAAPAEQTAPAAEMVEGSKETLLVVEDEADLRDVIIQILQGHGYRTYDAGTGEEALELCGRLQGGKIDMLLTDVVMPGMNGKELADEMTRQYPGVKVLFISGYTGKRIVTHEILSRGLSFLAKPFSPMELLQKIRQILDSKNWT